MSKKVFIFSNFKENSQTALSELRNILLSRGYEILDEFSDSADLLMCIGGDGTFLSFIHKCRFPKIPVLGVNTGHLGFFQECSPDKMSDAIDDIEIGRHSIQIIKPLQARIVTARNQFYRIGINEILVRGQYSHVSQFSVSIDDTKVQDFSGDGILVSPDLDVLQLTPVAPMNTSAYRCFHSSILLPANERIVISGIGRSTKGTIILSFDGRTHEFSNVEYVEITQSDKEVHLIRNPDYDYWQKLSSKLL